MKKRNVGVIAALAIGAMLLFATGVMAFTMSWNPVTEYTDNTLIGAEAGGVFYNIEMDGVVTASKLSGTSWTLPPVPKKSTHTFRAQTELGALDNTGVPIRSAWSPFYTWTSPAGNPMAPGQLRVVP